MSAGQYFSDGETKVRMTEKEGGYSRVTFTRSGTDTTCDQCPCFDACMVGRECVKGTAFVTESL